MEFPAPWACAGSSGPCGFFEAVLEMRYIILSVDIFLEP